MGIGYYVVGSLVFWFFFGVIKDFTDRSAKRQEILDERKIQMETVIHEKIDKLLKKHKNKVTNGSLQINHKFEYKDFGFQDYNASASLKLRLNFQNNQTKHSYQITGYLQGKIVLSEKKGDYVDSTPGPSSFILDIFWLPFKIIGIIVGIIWWLLVIILTIILFLGILLLVYISLKVMIENQFRYWKFQLFRSQFEKFVDNLNS